MISLERRMHPHPDVVDRQLHSEETVLLHLRTNVYYTLNPTGTRIWRGVKRQLTLRQICHRLQREFDVSRGMAELSILTLIDELRRENLIEEVESEESVESS